MVLRVIISTAEWLPPCSPDCLPITSYWTCIWGLWHVLAHTNRKGPGVTRSVFTVTSNRHWFLWQHERNMFNNLALFFKIYFNLLTFCLSFLSSFLLCVCVCDREGEGERQLSICWQGLMRCAMSNYLSSQWISELTLMAAIRRAHTRTHMHKHKHTHRLEQFRGHKRVQHQIILLMQTGQK